MTQLSDDCFAFPGGRLSIEDGIRCITERVTSVTASEAVSLLAADGRGLAVGILAPIDLPPWGNAAVDGYAVRHADLVENRATCLPVEGRDVAGALSSVALAAATARRIFTGARLPAGADTIFMQEDVEARGAEVLLPPGLKH